MTLLRRAPVVDELVVGDESAVMVGDSVIVLSALATAVLGRVGDDEVGAPDIAETLVETFGEPPADTDPIAMVDGLIDDLVQSGLLVSRDLE